VQSENGLNFNERILNKKFGLLEMPEMHLYSYTGSIVYSQRELCQTGLGLCTARLRCDVRPSRIITNKYHKMKYFRWWNVFDNMCRIGRWSFWS